ncbi:MAG: PDDEXK nuclease domain-containing protein [Bacteroidales bacterium]|nr:PDDEXK nuclease domain-containing protein [Bacteroidales bacterium]HNW74170.1 PDDEXK nuclease domain-containing protein [Bacteroidales bacterium]HPS51428.1 PDDEXK nuclease domain-containing protein [Bacteroidales bacterium]
MLQKEFAEIIYLIRQARSKALMHVNTELINLYWNVGGYISRKIAVSAWGDRTIDELAEVIQKEHPDLKGFNRSGLYRMKRFYEIYAQSTFVSPVLTQVQISESQPDEIVSTLLTQLETSDIRGSILARISWSHHLVLLSRTKTEEEREFYLRLCIKENIRVRELERQISSGNFERVMMGSLKLPPVLNEIHPEAANTLKDTYIFEFLHLPEHHSERDLQKGIVRQMKNFILELGRDFIFIGEEFKIQVGNGDFFIDLLFFHRGLQCLVAIELKADKFRPEHLGQLNFYLEALDRDVKKSNENPSIGVLLCKDNDSEVVEYALSRTLSPTMVTEYKTKLPDKKLLQQKLRELFDNSNETV